MKFQKISIFAIVSTFLINVVAAVPDVNDSALTWFLWNISVIVTSVTGMFNSVMSVFMEPPLVVFVGLGIFAFVIGIVGKYLKGRR